MSAFNIAKGNTWQQGMHDNVEHVAIGPQCVTFHVSGSYTICKLTRGANH